MTAIASPSQVELLDREVCATVFPPPPDLTISEFADREIIVTTGPLAGTHWQTAFAPYQAGIMNALLEPGVEIVVVCGSAQWGKTACAVCVVAYHMVHDPSPILVVEPTVDPMAKDFSRNRLKPVIEASPALKARVAKARSRDAANTTLAIQFSGGDVAIGGANSAASLAARSRRLLVLDEVDRYPKELPGEGSTLAIAFKRTQAYRRRRRILMLSSPTLRGGPIDTWFHRGDQRYFHVPCPGCGHMHAFRWENVRWTDDDPVTARLHCPACDYAIDDAERVAILARGEWRATKPDRDDRSIVSLHLWEAYSPLSSLREIVTVFLRARAAQKAGDRSEMHTWINTTLGEPVEPDDGEGVEPHMLLLRREPYGQDVDAPEGVCAVTLGVDVQDDRLEYLVVGAGPDEETWLLDRGVLPGDTSRPEPWDMLAELLDVEYRHALGVTLPILATGVDTAGHRTSEAYDFCHRKAARRVFAMIGRDGQRPIVSSPAPRRWGRGARQVPLYTIGVDSAKALFVSRLALTEAGPGYVHIPHADWADEELAAQLTSERLVTRWHKGVPDTFWKKIRPRNEMLDAYILAYAALRLCNPKLDQWAEALRQRAAGTDAQLAPPPPPRRAPWLSPRRGWLGRRG
jgi:phage terminase large subunit GpA-like protein